MATRGLNLGIDFTGGILLEVKYPQAADLVAIRQNLAEAGFERNVVQEFGTSDDVLVRLPPQPGKMPMQFVTPCSLSFRTVIRM